MHTARTLGVPVLSVRAGQLPGLDRNGPQASTRLWDFLCYGPSGCGVGCSSLIGFTHGLCLRDAVFRVEVIDA